MVEPTYSQIEAARKAYHEAVNGQRGISSEVVKQMLMAAQKVDRNIYGDCHFGGGVGDVHFMTTSKEARDEIMRWNHSHTATVPYHEQHTIPELKQLREEVKKFRDGIDVA